jgi:glycogen synthase kinase 3 beta
LEVKICDFGSSKMFTQIEKNIPYICSRYYRAPELLFNYALYGTEVDVWSAGCILAEMLAREPVFPGDSTLEQLIEIIKVLGAPTAGFLAKYAKDFQKGLALPDIPCTPWAKVLEKYKPEPELLDLIAQILVFDPQRRLTPFAILMHPYFHDLAEPVHQPYTGKLPNLLAFDELKTAGNGREIAKLANCYGKSKLLKPPSLESKTSSLETGDTSESTCKWGQEQSETSESIHNIEEPDLALSANN